MRGFTLLELLITLALLAIIAAIAAPSMAETLERSRANALALQLTGSLHLARTFAVLHQRPTVICKSSSGNQCSTTGDWSQGWIVFEDLDADGDCAAPAAAEVCADGGRILRSESLRNPSSIKLLGNQNIQSKVRYNPQGRVSGTNGTFTLCRSRDNAILGGIVVSTPGRIRKAEAGDSTKCN